MRELSVFIVLLLAIGFPICNTFVNRPLNNFISPVIGSSIVENVHVIPDLSSTEIILKEPEVIYYKTIEVDPQAAEIARQWAIVDKYHIDISYHKLTDAEALEILRQSIIENRKYNEVK